MKLAFLIVLALVPALVNGLSSRGLLRRLQAADLAERLWRHRIRTIQINASGVVVAFVVAGRHGFWIVPLLLVASLAAGFRLRRTLFEESWAFPTYLGFLLRINTAFLGFWVVLSLSPMLISATASPYRWPVGIFLGSLLLLWGSRFSRIFPRILGAEPMGEVGLAPFREGFARVDGRSSAAKPALYRAPTKGGVFVNAAALPSVRRPGVLFWESLLHRLEPAEVVAVYAHEVAHLEQFDRRRVRKLAAAERSLVLLAALLPPLLSGRPELLGFFGAIWPLLVLGAYLLIQAGSKRRETGADLRALELCGDPDALIRALTQLNLVARLPRRFALEEEERLSHPSLARRLQAIRRAAGRALETDAGNSADLQRRWQRVIGAAAERCLIFEPDRVSWLEGVDPEAGGDAEALRRSAASVRTVAYSQLAELRVATKSRGPELAATTIQGESWAVPLVAGSVAEVQGVLDDVDRELAPRAILRGPSPLIKNLLRLAASLGMVLSLFPPMVFSFVLPGLIGLVRPRPASVAAFGVAGVAAALLRLRLPSWLDAGSATRWPVSILLLLVSLPALVVAVRWARQDPERRHDSAWVTALVLGLPAGLILAGVLTLLGSSGKLDPLSLQQMVSQLPGLALLLLAAATALFFRSTRISRTLATLALLIAASVVAVGSPSFERAFVHDPLLFRAELEQPATRRLERIAWLPLEGHAAEKLRLSATGRLYAVSSYLDDGYHWRVGRVKGAPLPTGDLEAIDVRFLDEHRILALEPETGSDSAAWSLRLRVLEGNEPAIEVASLRGLVGGSLMVDPTDGRWWVSGRSEGQEQGEGQVLLSGVVGTEGTRRLSWRLPEGPGPGYAEWAPAWRGGALATRWSSPANDESLPALAAGGRNQVWWLEGEEAKLLTSSRLDATCAAVPTGAPVGLCVVNRMGQTHLWRVNGLAGGPPSLEPVARFLSDPGVEIQWSDSGALISSYSGQLWRWDRASAALEELIAPGLTGVVDVALTPSGAIGVLGWSDAEFVLGLYR